MAPQQVLDRMQSMAPMRPTETMAQQALGGQTGGTYLAPALYRPVVQVCPGTHCTFSLLIRVARGSTFSLLPCGPPASVALKTSHNPLAGSTIRICS